MKRIGYIDGRRLFLADGQALSFGTDKDIAVSFNASLNALAFAGNVYFNDGDVYFYAGSSWNIFWDMSEKRLQTMNAHIMLGDYSTLYFGDDKDVCFNAYGADGLRITYLAHDTGYVEVGNSTKALDIKLWLGAGGGYIHMDVGLKRLILSATDIDMMVNTKIYIGGGVTAYIHSGSTGRIDFTAAAKIYMNSPLVMGTNQKLYIGSTAGAYLNADVAGNLQIAAVALGVISIISVVASKSSIVIGTAVTSSVVISGGHLNLPVTNVNGTVKGEIWVESTDARLKYFDGSNVKVCTLD